MEGIDGCLAVALNLLDAANNPASIACNTYIEVDGLVQPAPAPRFGRTPSEVRHGGHDVGQDTDAVLMEMGFGEQELAGLRADGSIV